MSQHQSDSTLSLTGRWTTEEKHAGPRPIALGAGAWKGALFLAGVVATAALAAWPFLEPRLTLTFDSVFHYYALVQLDHLFEQGILYPRWFPFSISGYGSPFFQYYAPLAHYSVQALSLLGLETLTALRLAWGLMMVGGALGMYLWVWDLLGRGAALVAAAAYVCAPYMLFNAFLRGGFSEQCALMLMPFALWAFGRLATTGRTRYLAAGAAACGGIVLAHSLTAVLFTPVLVAYSLLLAWGRARPVDRGRVLLLQGAAMGLGLGLSAIFWLPFIVERNAFHNHLAFGNPALDYHRHFIPLEELLSLPFTTTLLPGLSLVAVGLGTFALLAVSWRGLRTVPDEAVPSGFVLESILVWFAALVAVACAFMTLPASVRIWEAIPLLRFFQFTHRFLTVGIVFVAFLAGAGARRLQQSLTAAGPAERAAGVRRVVQAGLLLATVVLLASHTWKLSQQVRFYAPLPEIDMDFLMQKDRETAPGAGEYPTMFVPATVKEMPPLAEMGQDGSERFDSRSLPAGAAVVKASYGLLRYELTLSSAEPFSARFRTFDFPGWQAELDGRPVPITPTDPHGLISVAVPAGEHRLEVWFGSTPVRTVAAGLSLASAVVLGSFVVARTWHRFGRKRSRTHTHEGTPGTRM